MADPIAAAASIACAVLVVVATGATGQMRIYSTFSTSRELGIDGIQNSLNLTRRYCYPARSQRVAVHAHPLVSLATAVIDALDAP
jgi:hypothetical protein